MMPDVSFGDLVAVCAMGFLIPLALGFFPRLRLPAVALQIVAGIVVGPAGLGWVRPNLPVQILALLGLAFLLFLSGLEVELERLRGRPLELAAAGFAVSVGLALGAGWGLSALGLVEAPLLVAIVLTATGLGVVVPALKDAGEASTGFGQLVITASSIADFGSVVLLTLLFSRETSGAGSRALLLAGLVLAAAVVGLTIAGAGRSMRLGEVLRRLQDTTAQIRVRGAVLLLVAFAALAERLGLEAILGAFLAGAILSAVGRDRAMLHEHFRVKLEAIGFGFLVPVFFVASGLRFDLGALTHDPSALAEVPVFVAALLVARGLPAFLYRRDIGTRRAVAAGLLQATSLAFIVATAQIGTELGLLDGATAAALVAAGLVSVVVFPGAALAVLAVDRRDAASLPSTP